MRERAKGRLATNQVFLGRRLFIFDRIAPSRLNCRQQRQPVAFGISIDRYGHTCRAVHRARQSANGARDQTAQDRSCHEILQSLARCETHGTAPTRLWRSIKKSERSKINRPMNTAVRDRPNTSVVARSLVMTSLPRIRVLEVVNFFKASARTNARTSIRR